MKILYAIQATGNGHISRAMEILPYLEKYGQVDLFLSGQNHTMDMGTEVKYRSKGLSFFYTGNGGLDYMKTISRFSPLRLAREVAELPVEQYDFVINDFESITAMACAYKGVPSIAFGHQASFLSDKTPRPNQKSVIGEWVLKNYAIASRYLGLHFTSYDDFILPPVISSAIYHAEPVNDGHITVYLPSYSDHHIVSVLPKSAPHRFHVFSRETKYIKKRGNIIFYPVDKLSFQNDLIRCRAVITNAGFETPAEAIYLGKKLLVIPIKGQYEQACNAAALRNMGVSCLDRIGPEFYRYYFEWLHKKETAKLPYTYTSEFIVDYMMNHCESFIKLPELV